VKGTAGQSGLRQNSVPAEVRRSRNGSPRRSEVPEGPLAVGYAGGRVDVEASADETLVHARGLRERRVQGNRELLARLDQPQYV
jgi:hypothetical protein